MHYHHGSAGADMGIRRFIAKAQMIIADNSLNCVRFPALAPDFGPGGPTGSIIHGAIFRTSGP
jgi:hypothetical protein